MADGLEWGSLGEGGPLASSTRWSPGHRGDRSASNPSVLHHNGSIALPGLHSLEWMTCLWMDSLQGLKGLLGNSFIDLKMGLISNTC